MVGIKEGGNERERERVKKMFQDAASLHKYLNILRACFNPFHVG